MFPLNQANMLTAVSGVLDLAASYTVDINDYGKILNFTAVATCTLPPASGFHHGFQIAIFNTHATSDVTFSANIISTGTKVAAKKACSAVVLNGSWYVVGGVS